MVYLRAGFIVYMGIVCLTFRRLVLHTIAWNIQSDVLPYSSTDIIFSVFYIRKLISGGLDKIETIIVTPNQPINIYIAHKYIKKIKIRLHCLFEEISTKNVSHEYKI